MMDGNESGGLWQREDYSSRGLTAQQALALEMKSAKAMNASRLSPEKMAAIVARHQVERDAGAFIDRPLAPDIDDVGRDQLLANAREDAAHALGLCILVARRQRWILRVGWGAFGLLAYIAWRVS